MPGAAKKLHLCPLADPPTPTPHTPPTGSIIQKMITVTVFIEGEPVLVPGDKCVCNSPSPNVINGGSTKVTICGQPAVRQFDTTLHGGQIIAGSTKVFIG